MLQQIPHWLIYTIGFTAQLLFSARTLIQWFRSEKEHQNASPTLYWIFSVLGAYIMFVYGILRNDFSIVLGQFISYYIYLWNLDAKGIWKKISAVLRIILVATPVVACILLLKNAQEYLSGMFNSKDVPFWLIVFGSAGQVIFTFRFIYQWIVSNIRKKSVLPVGFWIISLVGSGIIIAYGIFRKDPVLILGQSFGFVAYVRNIMIGLSKKNRDETVKDR